MRSKKRRNALTEDDTVAILAKLPRKSTKKPGTPQPGKYILRQLRSAGYIGAPPDSQDPDGSDFQESDVVLKFGSLRLVQIGRSKDFCQIHEKRFDHPKISRRHAIIRKQPDGKLTIETMCSSRVEVDGKWIENEMTCELKVGDTIKFAPKIIWFKLGLMTPDGVSFSSDEDRADLRYRAKLTVLKSAQEQQQQSFEAEMAANVAKRKKLEDELGSIGIKLKEIKEAEEKLRCQLTATIAKEEALKANIFKFQNDSNAKIKAIEDKLNRAVIERTAELEKQKQADLDSIARVNAELQCPICQELFVKAVTLNCTHTFCTECIHKWAEASAKPSNDKGTCASCRVNIVSMTPCRVVDLVIENLVKNWPKQKAEERAVLEAQHETWRCEREAKTRSERPVQLRQNASSSDSNNQSTNSSSNPGNQPAAANSLLPRQRLRALPQLGHLRNSPVDTPRDSPNSAVSRNDFINAHSPTMQSLSRGLSLALSPSVPFTNAPSPVGSTTASATLSRSSSGITSSLRVGPHPTPSPAPTSGTVPLVVIE